jgi:hypothetical protein
MIESIDFDGRIGRVVSYIVALGSVVGLGTVAIGSAPEARRSDLMGSGTALIASNEPGQALLADGPTGKGLAKVDVPGAKGNQMHIEQRDGHSYLVVTDKATRRSTVYQINDAELKIGAKRDAAAGVRIVRGGGAAFLVDEPAGSVTPVDPNTLQDVAPALRFSGRIDVAADRTGKLAVLEVAEAKVSMIEGGMGSEPYPVGSAGDQVTVTSVGGQVVAVNAQQSAAFLFGTRGAPKELPLPRGEGELLVPESADGHVLNLLRRHGAKGELVALDVEHRHVAARPLDVDVTGVAPPLATDGAVYLFDAGSATVTTIDPSTGKVLSSVHPEVGRGPNVEAFVKDGFLWVNNPYGSKATVVDQRGRLKAVDKYDKRVPTADKKVKPHPKKQQPPQQGGNHPVTVPGLRPPPVALPPSAPVARAVAGNREVTLAWTVPSDGGSRITGYKLVCRPQCGRTAQRDLPGTALSARVDGLTNGESYVFELSAGNSVGYGPPAVVGPVTPTADVPSAPSWVAAKLTTSGDVTLEWEARSEGLAIRGFRIEGTSSNRTVVPADKSFFVSGANARRFTVRAAELGLDVDADPDFRFSVTTVAGTESGEAESAPSKPSRAVDPFRVPEFPPEAAVTATEGDANAVLTWPQGAHNGRPTSYRVMCKSGCASPGQQLWDSAGALAEPMQAQIGGLTNGGTYVLAVTGYHAEGGTTRELTIPVRPHRAPGVNMTGNGSDSYQSGYVTFEVYAYGSGVNCYATEPAARPVACGGKETFSIEPYKTYRVTICAKNDRGDENCQAREIRAQDPPTVTVRVSKPGLGYTTWALRSRPDQNSPSVGSAYEGDTVTMICQRKGTNPYGYGDVWSYINRNGTYAWISPGFGDGVSGTSFDPRVTQYCPPGV